MLGLGQSEDWESDCAKTGNLLAAGKDLLGKHPYSGWRQERMEEYLERFRMHQTGHMDSWMEGIQMVEEQRGQVRKAEQELVGIPVHPGLQRRKPVPGAAPEVEDSDVDRWQQPLGSRLQRQGQCRSGPGCPGLGWQMMQG